VAAIDNPERVAVTIDHDIDVETLLQCRLPMPAADSAAAIILVDGSKYLMQLRDRKPTIYYPGHWGLFGGAVDGDESPDLTVRRELEEELGFNPPEIDFLTEFTFDLSFIGNARIYRRYYEVRIGGEQIAALRLTEGSAMEAFRPETLFTLHLTPYDSFAVWLHYLKQRGMTAPRPTA
jgi:8-oxo-dGTP pyrophosphatase MutT (NUDIX family)